MGKKKTAKAHEVDAVVLDLDLSPRFVFRLPDSDRVWDLPNLRDLPLGYRARMSDAAGPVERAKRLGKEPTRDQLEALGRAQILVLDAVAPGLTDALPEAGLAKMLIAWATHSGVSLGESPASAS